jgi:hypothetical protein
VNPALPLDGLCVARVRLYHRSLWKYGEASSGRLRDGTALAMILAFDEQAVKEELRELPESSRLAFAASCAERLAGVCRQFSHRKRRTDQANLIEDAREYIWAHILLAPDINTADELLSELLELIPNDEEPDWTDLTSYAQNGLTALAYCLRCMHSNFDAQEAAWAARHLYEAADQYAIDNHEVSPYEPGGEVALLGSAVIQAELRRQVRDLADLRSAGEPLSQTFLEALRERGIAEQAISHVE